ncbi:MAG: DUF1292 domain-containing protein [Coprobacillus sp.]|nr:DUF1292 domain-containing protein [Coprobacillus sp.]
MKKENMTDDEITIIDDDGNEMTYQILFTYDNEDRGCSYVLFFAPESEDEIIALRYDEEGNLYDIESDEEFDEIEEVLEAFEHDLDEAEAEEDESSDEDEA